MSAVLPKGKSGWQEFLHFNDPLWESLAATIFLFLGLSLSYFDGSAPFSNLMYFGAVIAGSFRHVRTARRQFARHRQLTLNLLVLLILFSACALQLWQDAACLVVIYGLALRLDHWPRLMVERYQLRLQKFHPPKAWILEADQMRAVPASMLNVNDEYLVAPGQRMVTDGQIVKGDSLVDESLLSSEKIAVRKHPHDPVYAGTLNKEATLTIRVSRRREDSVLYRSIGILKDAQLFPGELEIRLGQISSRYLPVLLLSSVLMIVASLIFSEQGLLWSQRWLVVLLAMIPFSLRVAASSVYRMALNVAARRGVLFKSARQLEKVGRLDILAFDKTGTLSTGQPRLRQIQTMAAFSEHEILAIVAAMEEGSSHAYARFFQQLARQKKLPALEIEQRQTIAGFGRRGFYQGEEFFFGHPRLFEQLGMDSAQIRLRIEEFQAQGHSCLLLGTAEQLLALLILEDPIKAQAATCLKEIRQLGVGRFALLTREARPAAAKLAEQLGIDEYYVDLSTADKARLLVEMASVHGCVGLVTDAPHAKTLLDLADVGIVLGSVNHIDTLNSEPVLLLSNNLKQLAYLMRLSHHCKLLVRHNLIFAGGINLVLAVSALCGWLGLGSVMLIHLCAQIGLVAHSYGSIRRV